MARGPLIPGLREYDAPRRRRSPVFWMWTIGAVAAVAALVVLGGLVAGIGPLRALGTDEAPLTPVAWRPTVDAQVIQVAVALPESGLCTGDEVVVRSLEGDCTIRHPDFIAIGIQGEVYANSAAWVAANLDFPAEADVP